MTHQTHEFSMSAAATGRVRIEALAPVVRFSLRARAARVPALSEALGLDLPGRVGRTAEARGCTVLCLGPDEWLIHAPEAARDEIVAASAEAYGTTPHSLVDISDREMTYEITGGAAQELLSIGCPRDLDRLAPGQAVRTVFDTVQVVLWRDGEQAFRLDVWRSFAPHVCALLDTGQRELAAGL